MGLIKCKECDKQVSDEAKTCPSCGAPVPKSVSLVGKILVIGIAVYLVAMCTKSGTSTPPPQPPTAAQIQQEKDFQRAVGGLRYVREQTKNPASFEAVSVLMIGSSTLCISYRGRNSFNAIVPGVYVFTDTVSSSLPKDWNRLCAGKIGTDLTHAKHAL